MVHKGQQVLRSYLVEMNGCLSICQAAVHLKIEVFLKIISFDLD